MDKVLKKITHEEIDESFFNRDQARIVLAPHHGSWELLNLWLSHHATLYSLYKPSSSEGIEQYVLDGRTRNGAILVPANTGGLRKLLHGLKADSCCMILPDQKPGRNTARIDSNFFNHQVSTTLLVKNLVSRIPCQVYIAAVTRELESAEYRITIRQLEREQLLQDDQHSADYMNRAIEEFIGQHIAQYQWAYKRFARRDYMVMNQSEF
jgi:KDO2-lipid IV(A) lauroyltransferase